MNYNTTVAQIAKLLAEAGTAHHQYEQTVLKGVYDQEWPAWYAGYILERGLNSMLRRPVNRDTLSQFLLQSNEMRQKQVPEPGWVEYTAHDIVARLYY
jgi:hypothetical protein